MPKDYDLSVYQHAILNMKGLQYTDRLGKIRLCHPCFKALSLGTTPRLALANFLYYGCNSLPDEVRKDLNNATLFELKLVARSRCNSVCCRFNSSRRQTEDLRSSKQSTLAQARKGVRGNVVVTPLDVICLNEVIPPNSDSIRDTMCAIFVSETVPTHTSISKFGPMPVRKSRVKRIIQFLLKFNYYYLPVDGFGYSEKNLEGLFSSKNDEDLPDAVHIGHISSSNAIESSTSDYTPRNFDSVADNEDWNELLMENIGFTDGDDSPASYHQMRELALQRCLLGKPFLVSGSGSRLVPDFNNPCILTWLFPHLDPWGIGGFHHPGRRLRITMEEQVRHLLLIDDSPFTRDPEFAFMFHNVLRKSTVARQLRFAVTQKTHRAIICDLLSLEPEVLIDLNKCCKEDKRYVPSTDDEKKAFSVLRRLRLVSKHVPGSDGYKAVLRNQIQSLIVYRGPPTLFITLNLSDVDNPIVRLYAGENIDLDDISRGEDMSEWKRKLLAACNPRACAQFFDLMITKFIAVILQYGRNEPGLYGKCEAYFGTVEAQGKGTLHCHMLIWLKGHLPPQQLREKMVALEEYQKQVLSWLESVIMCEFPSDTPCIQSEHPRRLLHRELGNPHPGTIPQPLIPKDVNGVTAFWRVFREHVTQLLHEYNWHDHQATCWKYLRRGQQKTDANCRMGMDGLTREVSEMDPKTFQILLRRHHPRISAHTAEVTFLMQCNMDIEFVGSGDAAKAFVYYVTDYITKPSLSVHVGMAALSYAIKQIYNRKLDVSDTGVAPHASRAVTASVNIMMGRHEISHPQVMSYLIGGGDHYTSERFSTLQWGAISRYCDRVLEGNDKVDKDATVNISSSHDDLTVSNQQLDYTFRSLCPEFDSLCLYDFASVTDKEIYPKNGPIAEKQGSFDGRGHPQQKTHYLTIRKIQRIPVILGPSVPNPNTSEESKERWARDILLLLKPWREPSDVLESYSNWVEALTEFEKTMDNRLRRLIRNFNVLTECSEARPHHRRGNESRGEFGDSLDAQDKLSWEDTEFLYPNDQDPYSFGMIGADRDHEELHFDDQKIGGHLCWIISPEVTRLLSTCFPSGPLSETEYNLDYAASHVEDDDLDVIAVHSAFMSLKRKRRHLEHLEDETGSPTKPSMTDGPTMNQSILPFVLYQTLEEVSGVKSYADFMRSALESVIMDMNLGSNPALQ